MRSIHAWKQNGSDSLWLLSNKNFLEFIKKKYVNFFKALQKMATKIFFFFLTSLLLIFIDGWIDGYKDR